MPLWHTADTPGIPAVPQYQPGTPVVAYIAGLVALVLVAAIVVLGPKLLARRHDTDTDAKPKPAEPGPVETKAEEHDALVREMLADLRARLDRAVAAEVAAGKALRRCEAARHQSLADLREARWNLEAAREEIAVLRAQLQSRGWG